LVEVVRVERRSAVLTPSSLACLSNISTINLTAGCAHECRYCYTRGYRDYPGEERLKLYANTLEKLKDELARKRKQPRAVYFSPSSDLFQPVPEVLDLGYEVLAFLLEQGIGVSFLSKGVIPERHRALLQKYSDLVRAQIGVISLSASITEHIEPKTASPETRLRQAQELVQAGIPTQIRIDPILPGVTDDVDSLQNLCVRVHATGVRIIAASILFLRPALRASLTSHLAGVEWGNALLERYGAAQRMGIHAEHSSVMALPAEERRAILERLANIAKEYGLDMRICGCKNQDISQSLCNIAGSWAASDGDAVQLDLFGE
jgi:DNA repair photolyase